MPQHPLKSAKKILVVEDNKAHVRLIREALKESERDCDLATVKDGVEAMAYLRQGPNYPNAQRPDIILLDLNLPRKDGRQVLAELKTDPDLKRIPVIVITTSNNPEDIHHSYDLHANCYITKSRNLVQLFALFQEIESFWFDAVTLPID
jgi:chemotaxis family two-component system response regulator Rcp1